MARTAPPCNKDCEHCPYPGCVWDGLDYDDYREQDARDRELTQTAAQKKNAAWCLAYYAAHREVIAAKRRAYREANREKIRAQQRAYREAKKRSVERMPHEDWVQWYRELLTRSGPDLWDLIFDYMVDDDDINDVDLCRLSAEFTPVGGTSREV